MTKQVYLYKDVAQQFCLYKYTCPRKYDVQYMLWVQSKQIVNKNVESLYCLFLCMDRKILHSCLKRIKPSRGVMNEFT